MYKYAFVSQICNELQKLQIHRIPRRCLAGSTNSDIQLHIFTDASEAAYGIALYLHDTQNVNNTYKTELIYLFLVLN